VSAVEARIAAALALHGYAGSRLVLVGASTDDMDAYRFRISCQCGWSTLTAVLQADRPKGERDFGTLHSAHQASVVAALPGIAIVELPGYSEHVTDTRPGFEGLTFPAWYPEGLADIGAAVGQHPGIVEARWSGMSMWTPAEAESVAAALLAAARAAGGQA
jgi:hypothetical protein